jgi:hypothetical protein
MYKNILVTLLIVQIIIFQSLAFSQEKSTGINLRDLALPSEFEGIKKEAGAVYYSGTSKGKALIPVNVWGEVNKAGLHYLPIDTDLVLGLSLAGGPKSTAQLSKIKVTRNNNNQISEYKFDLSEGGTPEAYKLKLEPGDTVFVEREYFYENRAYYTSIIGVFATVLSSILLYRQVKN